ncbi:MAG: HlyD family efflux transporter periplasmic adaptor subunit [Thermostichus sp. DG02_5_bins_236]
MSAKLLCPKEKEISAQQARVQQLQASLASLDVALSKSVIRAPFAGRIALGHVDEGTVVGSGQPVLRLVESGAWEARIGVPTHLLPPEESRQTLEVGSQSYEAEVVGRSTRHVVATTLLVGFIPLLFDATGFWPPLAICIAGGLGGTTILALYAVPSAHLLLNRSGKPRQG